MGSAIARTTHCGVHINAGCEIGVASTKAYTSQMVAITMMALALSEDSIAKRPKRDAIIDALGALPDALRKVRDVLCSVCSAMKPQTFYCRLAQHEPIIAALEALHMSEVAVGGPLH